MPEDGHITDGADGGTPVGLGAESRAAATSQGPGMAKILPFRRDWFGPIDELVPPYPGPADDPIDDRVPRLSERSDGPALISAASFWDEDADVVHQVVESIHQVGESLDPRWIGDVGPAGAALTPALPLEPAEVEHPESPGEPPERVRRHRSALRLGAGLSLVIVCAAVALLWLTGALGHPHPIASAHHRDRNAEHATVRGVDGGAEHKSLAAVNPERTVTVDVAARTLHRAHKRHVHKRAVAVTRAVAAASQTSHLSSSPAESAGTPTSKPPTTSEPARSASAPSGGCAQSPDSGCLP